MTKKLIIPIEDIPTKRQLVYVGDHIRPSTATSIVFLNENTLACSHFNGCKIFLIRFDFNEGTHHILDTVDTTYNNEKTEPDLMATDGHGNIATSNFFHKACTFYKYENDTINLAGDSHYQISDYAHGIKFYNSDIIAFTSRGKGGGVYFVNRITHQPLFKILSPGLSVQDVCFLSPNRMAMISGLGSPKLYSDNIYASTLHIIDFDITKKSAAVIEKRIFEASHFDNIVLYKDDLYFTDQYNNKVLRMNAQTLALKPAFVDYDFPHGIDVNYDILAVTNYGTNTLELRALS
jgi:hypothetical protein